MQDLTDAELHAVFGRAADYYVAQWRGTARRGYNWAAFFFGGVWLAFRRMYLFATIFWLLVLVISVGAEYIAGLFLRSTTRARWIDGATTLVFGFICGAAGNQVYFSHIRRITAETRAMRLSGDEHLAVLTARGGTRLWRAVGLLVLVIVTWMIMLTLAVIGDAIAR